MSLRVREDPFDCSVVAPAPELPFAPLGSDDPRVHRKVVTVLFCDVVGSTALGETVDPEALQGVLARYFERMKAIVESHGGSVEKFIGDAVMAVFGVPAVHEDDALRACRAAVEMRAAFPELGVQARIGVNTGGVVTGTEERLATGDAVNVAARLQNAADPDEILIGEATLELIRGAVESEPLRPLELKGKAEPVAAHRLITVLGAPERRHESRFVGRESELGLIREAWQRAQAHQGCELVTIAGDPGIGKSRLVAEALPAMDARVVRGRCLPYGEGITYWPVVEVIKQLDALPSDPDAGAAIRSLLGETDRPASPEEIAWAFRKLLEEQAPIAVVFDDIQWGEDTFLDLAESVGVLSAGAVILLVCMARPELSSRRPDWPIALRLEPLPDTAVNEILSGLTGDLRGRVATAAGGNPLFLTEMLAMAEENHEVEVPPTLRALLAARLDQLGSRERHVLECGAIEGEIFHRGAVQALALEEAQVTPHLTSLVRSQLIRPDRTQLPGEEGFRFRHLLIRDEAYEAVPKAARAELHERLAAWLEERGEELVERDELLGHHLEQAARYRQELGTTDPQLGQRAAERLASAGRRALWRGDEHAAVSLLERALELSRPVRLDIQLELDLADALQEQPDRAAAVAAAAVSRAAEAGEETGAALARAMVASFRNAAGETTIDEVERLVRAALPPLEQAQDHAGLARLYGALGQVSNARGQWEDWAQAAERAVLEARLAGRSDTNLYGLASALAEGPRPADDALEILDAYLPESARLLRRAELLAQLDRFEEAWSLAHDQARHLLDLGGSKTADHTLAAIAALAGDHEAAAHHLRLFCDFLEQRNQLAVLSTHLAELGRELCLLGRLDEAQPLAQLSRTLGDEEDSITQVAWRLTEALVRGGRERFAEAEQLAREAVEISNQTDLLNLQGTALQDLSQILAATGRTGEAADALRQALNRYRMKRNLAMIAQVEPRLEVLRAGPRL
jgi:class 3 adenylate cyclase